MLQLRGNERIIWTNEEVSGVLYANDAVYGRGLSNCRKCNTLIRGESARWPNTEKVINNLRAVKILHKCYRRK